MYSLKGTKVTVNSSTEKEIHFLREGNNNFDNLIYNTMTHMIHASIRKSNLYIPTSTFGYIYISTFVYIYLHLGIFAIGYIYIYICVYLHIYNLHVCKGILRTLSKFWLCAPNPAATTMHGAANFLRVHEYASTDGRCYI